VKTGGGNESSRTPVTYAPEITASAPSATQIIVFNNYNAADTVTVTGLSAGDIVTVYASLKGEVPLATATANAEGTAAISLDDGLFSPNGGKIYVTVKTADANESARTPVSYPKEAWSEVPKPSQVSVVNNYNDSDIITVTGLSAGDTVTVYASSSGTEVLGSAVADAEGTAEVTLSDGILSPKGGRIFITVKGSEANESKRASINYPKETHYLRSHALPNHRCELLQYLRHNYRHRSYARRHRRRLRFHEKHGAARQRGGECRGHGGNYFEQRDSIPERRQNLCFGENVRRE
jgi:hypothetical protein